VIAGIAATPDGGALCVEAAKLRSVLLSCIPSAARLEGRVTGFSQEAAGLHVRLEGRAGRRSQRKVHGAALVGADGASCAVRAALLGAAPVGKLALWRGVSSWQPGSPTFARDAGGACVGAAVTLGDRLHWCLLAPPQPPRAVNGEAAREALAAVAAPD
jgi:2-polyprenyl-6-methoxyphenol hydroxylase-like FAD-dependent oxidoreductase